MAYFYNFYVLFLDLFPSKNQLVRLGFTCRYIFFPWGQCLGGIFPLARQTRHRDFLEKNVNANVRSIFLMKFCTRVVDTIKAVLVPSLRNFPFYFQAIYKIYFQKLATLFFSSTNLPTNMLYFF